MNFIISASTDVGIVKSTNQDSLSVKVANTNQGKVAFAVLCDGMGGLSKGEVASAAVIRAFDHWFMNSFPKLCMGGISDLAITSQWNTIINNCNEKINEYGMRQGVRLGTTVVVVLLTQTRYYILNVGDSRAYEISTGVKQITEDQTLIAREIAQGRLTPEEAKTDRRRSVLLQCVGASECVTPDMFFGDVNKDTVFMLCSDGFRHVITPEEIYEKLNPAVLTNEGVMAKNSVDLIELNKFRKERDNISVALIKTV